MKSQRFKDTRMGEIVTQVPISEIANFEEFDGPEKPVCPYCKQAEVSADAAVRWDIEAQDWTVSNVFDKDRRCENLDCEYEGCEITEMWVSAEEPIKTDWLDNHLIISGLPEEATEKIKDRLRREF